jgi:hypothetical protein
MTLREYFLKLDWEIRNKSIKKACKDLDLNIRTITNMIYGHKPVSKKHCKYFEKITGKKVKIKDMRSDW